MSDTQAQSRNYGNIALWGLQILLALAFFAAGTTKLIGLEARVELFEMIGFGQWFRYVTGFVEVTAACLLLTRRTATLGGALIVCTMIGAVITHLALSFGTFVPAAILGCLGAIIAYFRLPYLKREKLKQA